MNRSDSGRCWNRQNPGWRSYAARAHSSHVVSSPVLLLLICILQPSAPPTPSPMSSSATVSSPSSPPPSASAGAAAAAATIVVRPVVASDAAAVGSVHVRAWQAGYAGLFDAAYLAGLSIPDRQKTWADRLADGGKDLIPGARMFVALDPVDGHVCAWLAAGPARSCTADASVAPTAPIPPSCGEILSLNAEPEAWGRGISSALLAEGVAELRRQGFERAMLWALKGNARGLRFYEREGWKLDGQTKEETREGQLVATVRLQREL